MKIIEKFLKGKYSNKCEDGYVITEDFIAVVDGATSRNKYLWNGKTSGEIAKDLILNTISKFEADINCKNFFESLKNVLKDKLDEQKEIPISEMLRASIVVYSKFYKEIWSLGDCKFCVNHIIFENKKEVDYYIANVRSMLVNSFILEGKTVAELLKDDLSRKMIEPLIDRQFYLENKAVEYGYPVLNSHCINYEMIVKYPVKDDDIIIFSTDGYPILKESLIESENELNRIIIEDPLCYNIYKSTKGLSPDATSFDDRCYIKFIV